MWYQIVGTSFFCIVAFYLLIGTLHHSSMEPPEMPLPKLHTLTAAQVLARIARDEFTVTQYAAALLERIEERNDVVRAWAYLDKDKVMKQAHALDQLPRAHRGPLHGVGVAIKDIMDTVDMPTQFGSALYKGHWPTVDASPVSILRSAGALIIGKATTTEFTVENSGPNTTNPHDGNRTPGGSSAGPAAAVADLETPLSFGTQNGGSLIRPASYTGIFAMKPTMHAISADGVKIVSISVDTVGFFARSMEDLQLVADVFKLWSDHPDSADVPLHEMRVAFVKTAMWPEAGPSTIAAMEKAANILKGHGVIVEEVELPAEFRDASTIQETHKIVLNTEAQAAFLQDYRLDKTKISPKIRSLVQNKAGVTHGQTVAAMDRYAHMRPTFDRFAADYSAIITPSADDIAPLGLKDMGAATFNVLWTGLHTPTINIPAFVGDQGMPVGLSIVAGRYRDQYLLKICRTLSELLMAEGGWVIKEPTSTPDSRPDSHF